MTPGLTSPGGRLPDELQAGARVVVVAEGKEHAISVGRTEMSASEMREKNKGIAIDSMHCLGDWLWRLELQ